jgi:hypothetical protein
MQVTGSRISDGNLRFSFHLQTLSFGESLQDITKNPNRINKENKTFSRGAEEK